jgi:hypothetical protein
VETSANIAFVDGEKCDGDTRASIKTYRIPLTLSAQQIN